MCNNTENQSFTKADLTILFYKNKYKLQIS